MRTCSSTLSVLCVAFSTTLTAAELALTDFYGCALNHATDACPPPLWEPTYNLTLSIVVNPGTNHQGNNAASYFIPPPTTLIWFHNTTNASQVN